MSPQETIQKVGMLCSSVNGCWLYLQPADTPLRCTMQYGPFLECAFCTLTRIAHALMMCADNVVVCQELRPAMQVLCSQRSNSPAIRGNMLT